MYQLIHNGILVPKYEAKGFKIKFKGKEIKLTPEQEEMAVAWVKKLGTKYVEDPVFVKNFFTDFCKTLGLQGNKEDFDFSEIVNFLNEEKLFKEKMDKQQKKLLAEERKRIREENKAKYGYAIVDGEKVEIANYMAEPSSIFMGRGDHPLRGRWKDGPKEEDIILNLSPDAPRPSGNWKEIVWMPECMWIAKWDDKLTGKEKYVWLADSCFVKQNREKEKYDKAIELGENYEKLMKHIKEGLVSEDIKIRKIATVCYLIDAVKMRVGDEKDKDEANTVGATTLTTDNVKIKSDNIVVFDFLGKDSVHWHKEVALPEEVVKNLKEFIKNPGKNGRIFKGVRSENVNAFLSSIVPGITAKVFRTYHATRIIDEYLSKSDVKEQDDEDYKKFVATLANLEAAIACNHKKSLPKNWENTLKKKMEMLERLMHQKGEAKYKGETQIKEKKEKYQNKINELKQKLEKNPENKKIKERIKSLTKQMKENEQKMKVRLETKIERLETKIEKLKLKIDLMKKTKDYNLNTSLKSYIDPRVYYRWFKKIGFDWKKYYSKTLQKKFSWVENE
ncbi:MAG: DNA topoisomerase I [Candidatus Aenigmarchaeota archaeon]|nr:DNA topoisomerase I [Candidatus Aenigmarchaeota archaeon]